MTNYPQSAYGPRDRVPWLENSGNGWGDSYCWPNGVPASLLSTVYTKDGTAVVVRKELAELVNVLFVISEEVFQYPLHNAGGVGGYTGGYENRPIAGTSTASAHSRGRAIDVRAQDNPQSWTFISTWPPDLIAVWESCNFYWGGRYIGARFDTMHVSYCGTPAQVAGDLARAQAYLRDHSSTSAGGGSGVPVPKPKPIDPTPAPAPAPKPVVIDGGVSVPGVTVKQVQEALNAHGASPKLATDNDWGKLTLAATQAFQRANGLSPDGWVGTLTWAKLKPAPAKPYTAPPFAFSLPAGHYYGLISGPNVSHGGINTTEKTAVKWIQIRLQELGFAPKTPGWADGKFEQPTKDAVARWQRARHSATTSRYGEIWADDWANLIRDR